MSRSSCLSPQNGGAVLGGVVGFAVDPGPPEDAEPGSCENADCVGVIASTGSCSFVDVCGPWRAVSGVVGEAGDGGAEPMVAGPSEGDAAALAGSVGDGSDAGFGGELVFGLEALAHIAELGEDLCGIDAAGAGKGHDDLAIGERRDRVLDACRELGELGDERRKHGRKRADEIALHLGLGFAGAAGGRGPEPGEEFGRL